MMKKYLFFLLLCLPGIVFSQTNATEMSRGFEINGYQISPSERLVYREQMTSGSDIALDGSEIDWLGYKYVPDKEIDFNKTSLIFAGHIIAFKEHFPIKTVELSSLRVIYSSIGYTAILSPLENRVYIGFSNGSFSNVDIKGYTHVAQCFFKNNKGQLFYIPFGQAQLVKVEALLDIPTLQHVADRYYVDKNGLYFFHSFYNFSIQKLESSNEKAIQPKLHGRYFTYGNAVYLYGGVDDPQSLRLNAAQFHTVYTTNGTYLGDGEKLLKVPYSLTTRISPVSVQDIIQKGAPQEPVNEWACFDIITVGNNKKGNTLYYSSKEIYAGSGIPSVLIKTPKGFYGVSGSSMTLEATKYDDIMIYNFDKKKYESIDIKEFRRITTNFYVYKGRMYYTYSIPFETTINLEKLHQICHHGKATSFYTDGRFLLGGYNLGKLQKEERNGQLWYSFAEPPFQHVDWESLQVVNEEIMVDKNNIYQIENTIIRTIPIKDMGLDIKVINVLK